MNKLLIVLISLMSLLVSQSKSTLTLDESYAKAEKNYPLIMQYDLIEKSTSFSMSNITKSYFPKVQLFGQYTTQSDVTHISLPLPGVSIPEPSKNQYRFYGEISQILTDIYKVMKVEKTAQLKGEIDKKYVEKEMHSVKERVLSLFFGILLTDAQLKLTTLKMKDLQTTIEDLNAKVKSGLVLQNNVDVLNAEVLSIQQGLIEISMSRKSFIEMLALYVNEKIDENTTFIRPEILERPKSNQRTELAMFKVQKELIHAQDDILSTNHIPHINLFLQYGIGKPALNMLNDEQDSYYIGGLRFAWDLSYLYSYSNEKEQLELKNQMITTNQKTFLHNISIQEKKNDSDIERVEKLLTSDKEIVALREKIQKNSKSQLENGVISALDYAAFVNAVDKARQNLELHTIEWVMLHYKQRLTLGN